MSLGGCTAETISPEEAATAEAQPDEPGQSGDENVGSTGQALQAVCDLYGECLATETNCGLTGHYYTMVMDWYLANC